MCTCSCTLNLTVLLEQSYINKETSPNKLQYFKKINSVNKTYIVEKKDIQCILMIRHKLKPYKQ